MVQKIGIWIVFAVLWVSIVDIAHSAQYSVVHFNPGALSTTFDDGYFSKNISGTWEDGLYGTTVASAYNGFGHNGEFIVFNKPVMLRRMVVRNLSGMDSLTVLLYDESGELIKQKTTITSSKRPVVSLVFNAKNVSKVVFNFSGGHDYYGDGRMTAWFEVADIEYKLMN